MPISTPSQHRSHDGRVHLARHRCGDCGTVSHLDVDRCPQCGAADLEPIQLSRRGTVLTFVVQHYLPPGFETPLVLAIVETPEGGRVFGRVDCAPDEVAIGTPVALKLRTRRDEGPASYGLVFVPDATGEDGTATDSDGDDAAEAGDA